MGLSRWEVVDDGRRPDKDSLANDVVQMVWKHGEEACADLLMSKEELKRGLLKMSTPALYCVFDALSKLEQQAE